MEKLFLVLFLAAAVDIIVFLGLAVFWGIRKMPRTMTFYLALPIGAILMTASAVMLVMSHVYISLLLIALSVGCAYLAAYIYIRKPRTIGMIFRILIFTILFYCIALVFVSYPYIKANTIFNKVQLGISPRNTDKNFDFTWTSVILDRRDIEDEYGEIMEKNNATFAKRYSLGGVLPIIVFFTYEGVSMLKINEFELDDF